MGTASFEAEVRPSGRGGGHLVEIPDEVVQRLGGKGRIPVAATFDGIPYRGSIVRMGGGAVLGVLKAILTQTGKGPGDTLIVTVENDEGPRTVEVPEELAEAFRHHPAAREAFDALSYSHRREYVAHITEAKRPQTRLTRVARTIEMLEEGGSRPG
ncbi:MAG TPA: YdeI/OmpD-associated family protein [Actinomycetota bacterium]|jgi:hypothetical protein